MSVRLFTITIHLSRKNQIIKSISDVPYPGKPLTKSGDSIRFLKQKIVISAQRSVVVKDETILESRTNSLHTQIIKCLLFLYTCNQSRVYVSGIEIKRGKSPGKFYSLDKKTQPIHGDFTIASVFPEGLKTLIWDENPSAKQLRVILTHYLSGLGSRDRYFRFERMWRCFEQLMIWHKLHGVGKPNDFEALLEIRSFISTNPGVFVQSSQIVDSITFEQLRDNFSWNNYLDNEFPLSGTSNSFKRYNDYFVGNYTDYRIMSLHKVLLPFRAVKLKAFGYFASINAHVTAFTSSTGSIKKNQDLVAFLCCRYCYFMRNKIFHGEMADYTFRFYSKVKEDKTIDFLNELLQNTVEDLLGVYLTL